MQRIAGSWRAWIVGILVAVISIWIVEESETFHSCLTGAQYQPSEPSLRSFSALIDRRRACLGTFVHQNESAITALATLFIALLTLTLWRSTEKMWSVTKIAADAAKNSADAAVAAERARFYVVITNHNFEEFVHAAKASRSSPETVHYANESTD